MRRCSAARGSSLNSLAAAPSFRSVTVTLISTASAPAVAAAIRPLGLGLLDIHTPARLRIQKRHRLLNPVKRIPITVLFVFRSNVDQIEQMIAAGEESRVDMDDLL